MGDSVSKNVKTIVKKITSPTSVKTSDKSKISGRKPLSKNDKPYVVKGFSRKIERSWQKFQTSRPVLSTAEYEKTEVVEEIEEIIPCLVCGCETFKPVFHPAKKDWEYKVVMCTECDLLYRNPNIIPEHLHKLYDGVNYNNFLSGKYSKSRQTKYKSVLASFNDLIPKESDPNDPLTVFDFGCGNGLALEVLKDRGYETWGIDLSPESIDSAKELLGHDRLWCGEPQDIPELEGKKFDYITLWSVLAHLPRPIETFSMLRSYLKPNGALLVFTVNANSLLLKKDRDDWNGFTRNHLAFYSPDTATKLFKKAGFGEVFHRPHYSNHLTELKTRLTEKEWGTFKTSVLEHRGGNMNRMLAFNK
ncbi:MAG: class I SAM-dependent methyltransferase [Hyphomicrobiales bacterium]